MVESKDHPEKLVGDLNNVTILMPSAPAFSWAKRLAMALEIVSST
jgi:hypothetical protein